MTRLGCLGMMLGLGARGGGHSTIKTISVYSLLKDMMSTQSLLGRWMCWNGQWPTGSSFCKIKVNIDFCV